MHTYRCLTFEVEGEHEELLTAALWEHGTLGIEQRRGGPRKRLLLAWFGDSGGTAPGPEVDVDWGRWGGRLVEQRSLAERDWLAEYRRRARPLAVGRSLWIDPREPGERPGEGPDEEPVEAAAGRRRLRLPARTAFGTGSHPSTQLAVELLEELPLAGRRLLDVGTGTGILAFAALHLGAAGALGIDVDVDAVLQAAQNARRNRMATALAAGGVDALSVLRRFDVIVANVLPRRLAPDLPTLCRLLDERGTAIFSGLVEEAEGEVVERLAGLGLQPLRRRERGGWVAFSAERSGR